ncbi:ankyrin repeat protein [Colletotrichum sojae]|uniref:Ankyrin repeat protein n=1 Tax=Colletotrichum sojae TaxID=2175907 RepID=A0A8H6J392_9PEZI|nr:ankyrin repeat protein [Colletotrichum sojae]
MGDHDDPPTCMSAVEHNAESVRDWTAHYFGCIEISQRPDFLSRIENKKFWDDYLEVQRGILMQKDQTPSLRKLDIDANIKVDKKILSLANDIEATYKRTDTVRKALAKDTCSCLKGEGGQEGNADHKSTSPNCNLIRCINNSRKSWKQSETFLSGMKLIRKWKNKDETSIDTGSETNEDETTTGKVKICMDDGRQAVRKIIKDFGNNSAQVFLDYSKDIAENNYNLKKDIKGHIMQWEILSQKEARDHEDSYESDGGDEMREAKSGVRGKRAEFAGNDSQRLVGEPPAMEEPAVNVSNRVKPKLRTQPAASFRSRGKARSSNEKFLRSEDDSNLKGTFPDQQMPLEYLLGETPFSGDKYGLLSRTRFKDRVRYVHIPYNNMEWVEEAIARYFDEKRPKHGGFGSRSGVKTHSQMILRPEYWRGQQHGGRRTLVHARHMRAICERISSKFWDSEDNPENLVLFMPFLHWEEDRKRDKIAKIIEEQSDKHQERRELKERKARNERIESRTCDGEVLKSNLRPVKHEGTKDPRFEDARKRNPSKDKSSTRERTMTGLVDGITNVDQILGGHDENGKRLEWKVSRLRIDKHGRLRCRNRLGQYLLDAARLYEAMTTYRDRKLLEEYLHNDPPLHPRRTLDQSYYWTLKTTKARDRDQVVYRGTTMNEQNIHRFHEFNKDSCKSKSLRSRIFRQPEFDPAGQDSTIGVYKWDGHWAKMDEFGCEHCRGEIRKLSRVVMVDQLWMWILDKKTIITSFPKRYGTNKQDASGVHKSIRTRIQTARKNQIRSVFDVALIILDECSNTFFDRTKTPANKQTVSFDHLWHWTQRAADIYNSTAKWATEDLSQLHLSLLNINPEGKLQREIKDIIDELDIMIHVNNKQREVIKRFTKHVEAMYDPTGEWRDETMSPDGDRSYRSQRQRRQNDSPYDNPETKEREQDEFSWFRKQAYDLILDVGDRITELEGLRKSAESTSQGIKDLLDLKQQQASILQAWQSVKQADESVRQGRSIMIFTIVTIIFLPLSFMSSVFGMNNSDFGDNHMSFLSQSRYIFSISAGVIMVSVIFAFWTFPRTLFWSAYKITETWLLVNTGIYRFWLYSTEKVKYLKTDALLKQLEKQVEDMKGEVKKSRRERKEQRKEKEEEKKEKDRRDKMARLSLIAFVLCAALAQIAPASAQQACRVTILSSSGAGSGTCVTGSASGSIQVPGGPSVAYVVADPCEFTITNGPFDGITGTATKVDKC